MERIEVNVSTGERKVIQLAESEVADASKRTAEEQAKRAAEQKPVTAEEVFSALKAKGLLSDSDMSVVSR